MPNKVLKAHLAPGAESHRAGAELPPFLLQIPPSLCLSQRACLLPTKIERNLGPVANWEGKKQN